MQPLALGLTAALCLGAPQANALYSDKLFLRANASINYDSNVLRFSDEVRVPARLGGPGKSDVFYGLGVGLRADLPVSRQRLRADLSVTQYSYDSYSLLDYTGYNGRASWDWRAGNDWYGTLTAGARQARQSISTEVGFFIPRLFRTYDEGATARYALTPRWELQGGFAAYQTRYQQEVARGGDFDSQLWDLGASYRSPRGNSTGARLRYERGEWINRLPGTNPLFGNAYDQYTGSAVIDWTVSGHARLSGDIGYTVRQGDQGTAGDFNGVSGNLKLDLSLSGKVFVGTRIYQTRGPFESPIANYTRQTGIDVLPTYQISGKMFLQGTLTYRVVDYLGLAQPGAVLPNGERRQDKLTYLGINLSYQATRTVSISTGVSEQWRTSNVPFGDFNAVMAYVQGAVEF